MNALADIVGGSYSGTSHIQQGDAIIVVLGILTLIMSDGNDIVIDLSLIKEE